jgi:hypothetical protein
MDKNKRFRIYKADIDTYRVLDTLTDRLIPQVGRYITVNEPVFRVDDEKYQKASLTNFQNSGDPMDYFAWIECDSFSWGVLYQAPYQIKFNPFKSNKFRLVPDLFWVTEAKVCTILGNDLYVNL